MAYQYLQFSISAIADYPRFLACLHQGAHGGSLLGDGVAQLSQVLNLDALCFVERLVQDPCDLVDVAADRCKLAVRRVQPRQLVICHDGLAGEVRLHQGCNPAAWCQAFDLASGGGRFHQEARHPHGHARGVGPLHIRFYGLVGVAILAGDGQDDGSRMTARRSSDSDSPRAFAMLRKRVLVPGSTSVFNTGIEGGEG